MTSEALELMKANASLFRKKAAVMKALEGGLAKTGENTHFKYKYVTASRIKHEVSRLLAENGLSLQMSGLNTEESSSGKILRIQFQITLCDLDTGATESSFWFGEASAGDDKAASKCATSALKYYLISNLLIADKEEDKRDTDNQKSRHPAPQAADVAPHWSLEDGAMERVYQWATKEHSMDTQAVTRIIAKTGKPITAFSKSDVMALIKQFAK
jgi:hypothetical protein